MFSKVATVAFILSNAYSAYAHGGVTSYIIGGTKLAGFEPYIGQPNQATAERSYSSFNPILSATDATMACNNNGGLGNTLQKDFTIAAGADITAGWPQWTHAEGPVTVYLAKCPGSSCTGVSNVGLKWFKIQEAGLLSGTVGAGKWGNGVVLDTLKWTTTIPSCLQPGAYLIRHELLALHQANTPQFYPECAQLIVTGSGTSSPSSDYLVSIPGAWGANDPGVNINIYMDPAKSQTTYQVPGPKVWTCGGGSSPITTTVPTSTTTTTVKTTDPTSTKTTTTPSPSPTGTVAHYGQCGGNGYTGPTVCVAPWSCVKSNDFYSQCL